MHPHARRGLLLNWNESRSHREEIAAAFAQRQAEGFVTKPSGTPDERFHRSITELLDEWWRIRGPRTTAVHIVGAERTARVYEMCDLLQRHNMPFAFHRADSEAGAAILQTRRSQRRHRAGRRPPRRPHARRSLQHRDRRCVGCTHPPRIRDLRPHRRRRRTRRSVSGRVRGVGGIAHGAHRADGHGRSGRNQLDDSQLPRLPAWDQRRRAGRPCLRPSHPVRDRDDLRPRAQRVCASTATYGSCNSPTAPTSRHGPS